MSIWNLNVNCGITFGEDSRVTVGEKLKSYGATTALLLYDMAMDQFGYQREIEKVINDANIKVVCYQVEEGEPTAQKSDRAYDSQRTSLLMQSSPSAGAAPWTPAKWWENSWRTAVRRGIIRIIHALETLYFVRSLHFRPLPVPELS